MPLDRSVADSRLDAVVDLLVATLPLLATLALYLPGGLAMPFRLVTLALAAAAAWATWRTRRPAAPRTLTAVAVVGACFAGFGALGWVRFGGGSAEDAVRVVLLWVLAAAIAVLATRRRTVLAVVSGWLVAAAVAGVVGFWEVATGRHLPKHASAADYASVPGWNIIASFFDNPNLYAYQVGVVLLLLPVAFVALPRGWRLALVPFGLAAAFLLVRTEGRIVVLAVLVGALLWAVRSRWGLVLAAGGVAAAALASVLRLPPAVAFWAEVDNALIEFEQVGASSWVRAELARSAAWIAEQSTWLGVGPGGFASWSLRPDNPYVYEQLNNAHSGLLEVLAEYGVVTLLALLVALVLAAVVGVRGALGRPAWQLDRVIAYAAAVLALTWPLLSAAHSTWLRQPLSAAHVATIVALVAWTEARAREDRP